MIQHYVPRWYLRRWAVGNPPEVCAIGHSGRVDILSLPRAGARDDWYAVDGADGIRDQSIETKRLHKVDSRGADAVRALLADSHLTGAQVNGLTTFLGWLVVRGPAFARTAERVADCLNARRASSEVDEIVGPDGPTGLLRSGKRLALPSGPFAFDRGDELGVLLRGKLPKEIGKMFHRRWQFASVHRFPGSALQTCDNPVVFVDEFAESPEFALESFFPLAPDALLAIGSESAPKPSLLDLDDQALAAAINELLRQSAAEHRYYSPPLLA